MCLILGTQVWDFVVSYLCLYAPGSKITKKFSSEVILAATRTSRKSLRVASLSFVPLFWNFEKVQATHSMNTLTHPDFLKLQQAPPFKWLIF